MKKINFENGNIEASAETMNALQDNTEEAIEKVTTFDLSQYSTDYVNTISRNICKIKSNVAYISLYMTTKTAISANAGRKIFDLPAKLLKAVSVDFVAVASGVVGRGYISNDGLYLRFEQEIPAGKNIVFNVSYICD